MITVGENLLLRMIIKSIIDNGEIMKNNILILKKIINVFVISLVIFALSYAINAIVIHNPREVVRTTGILLTEVKKIGIPGKITDYTVEKGVTFFKEKSQILITFKGDDELVFKHFRNYGQQNGWKCVNSNNQISLYNEKYSLAVSKTEKEYLLKMKFQ